MARTTCRLVHIARALALTTVGQWHLRSACMAAAHCICHTGSERNRTAAGRQCGLAPGSALTVVKPAILLRRRLDWMIATSSQMRLLVSKSSVRRW